MRVARRAQAAQFAANVLPIIRDVQAAGHTSLNAIARQLNARKVATANGEIHYLPHLHSSQRNSASEALNSAGTVQPPFRGRKRSRVKSASFGRFGATLDRLRHMVGPAPI